MDNNLLTEKMFKNIIYTIGLLLVAFLVFGTIVKIHDTYLAFRYSVYPNKSITVNGESKIKATPDVAYLNFTYQANGADKVKLDKDANASLNDFKSFLETQGIDKEDISLSQKSTNPTQYDSSGMTPTNYQLTELMTAELKGAQGMSQKVKTIADEAKKRDLMTGNNSDSPGLGCLGFENFSESLKSAWPDAIKDAQKKASELSAASGLSLGKIVTVSDNSYNQSSYGGGYGVSCSSDQAIDEEATIKPQELTANLSVTFEVK
ncbi:MAG TPA: SIMPL domain-containing protein [Candidatus Limnocylindria bacterium]|nr:SIMPL domain-containing protein [Candidatus Limnocylindria bacterium]